MSKLPYICNESDVQRIHVETTEKNGTYYFIQKKSVKRGYAAYRKVDSGKGKSYFVQVGLPKEEYIFLIKSGKIDKYMN